MIFLSTCNVLSMTDPKPFRVIGLMSGSSLDGLDMACCDFHQDDTGQWHFAITAAECAEYDAGWTSRLSSAREMTAHDLWQTHVDFGHFCGEAVTGFVKRHFLTDITCVASHGHTVFHYPQKRFTTQIGDGAALAVKSALPVICDFRSTDVAKGGQGAPLVPIADAMLFAEYPFLLNIGGIANLTVRQNDKTVAFDICSANQVLNIHAQKRQQPYDKNGELAAKGRINQELLSALNDLEFYKKSHPKSLDNGYTSQSVLPLFEQSNLTVEDKLHTYCEHIAIQIAAHIKTFKVGASDRILVTGGGALNDYLLERIKHYAPATVVKPDDKVVQYKEALAFAFLGVLRWSQEVNILHSVTGATADSIGGAVYLP